MRLRLNRKTLPLKKDDIDVDEVNVDGNFKIWFPDNIGLPKYYWGCVTVGSSFFWINGRKSSVSWKYHNKYQLRNQLARMGFLAEISISMFLKLR